MLEVIDKGSVSDAHPVPLLFVHGGWHSASCWANFVEFFADAGYRAVAVSLRGHGGSLTAKRFHACSIADYVNDVRTIADSLGGRPVLIAHSLGGFVVQRYLENHDAPAAVLVASVPPQGVLGLAMRIWSRHPWVSMRSLPVGNLAGFIGTVPLVREHLFSAHTPDDIVESSATIVQSEALPRLADRPDDPPSEDQAGHHPCAGSGRRGRRPRDQRRSARYGPGVPD